VATHTPGGCLGHATLDGRKSEIIEVFGGDLIVDDLQNNKGCRIEARLNGPDDRRLAVWTRVVQWMVDSQERLRRAANSVSGVPSISGQAAATYAAASFQGAET